MGQAQKFAREIIPAFNAITYFRIGTRLARAVSKWIYRVRLGYSDDESLKAIDPDATVIFVMNHRSNMDYILLTYMAATSTTLSYAVGEWARVFPIQGMIRSMGAYFIRRNSGDPLYRRVLARYVRMATREGVTQAVFPEGGLSRDGALRPPKLGLLGYMIGDFNPHSGRDVVFIPVGLNYDRVMEDRILTSRASKEIGGKTFKVSLGKIFRFILHNIKLRIQGKLYRYGYACVSFGTPISFKGWLEKQKCDLRELPSEERFERIETFGKDLMEKIGAVVPALPVSVVATVFLRAGQTPLSELEIKSRTFDIIKSLEEGGSHIHVPRQDRDYAVSAGLRMLHLRHLVVEKEGLYHAHPEETILLKYYANSIAHLLN
jgi:glycerol-3-phosphate O-acyltransferase